MTRMVPLTTSAAGTRYTVGVDGDKVIVQASADVSAMLEMNKRMFSANEGWGWAKSMRRCASIPHILRLKWLVEEGWDAWKEEHEDALNKKLNDAEWRHLRTAPGRL